MSDEKAKAVQEVAKCTTKAIEISAKFGKFLSSVFGTLPQDAIGLLGADWVNHARIRNSARLEQETEGYLRERRILGKTEPVSLNIAIPLIQAAQDESRDQLCKLWARMLANAMDPSRSSVVRHSIIATVKAFDPLDALVLEKFYNLPDNKYFDSRNFVKDLKVSIDELAVSIGNLEKLNCIKTRSTHMLSARTNHLGRKVIRTCSL